jgi:hypothetical protein
VVIFSSVIAQNGPEKSFGAHPTQMLKKQAMDIGWQEGLNSIITHAPYLIVLSADMERTK